MVPVSTDRLDIKLDSATTYSHFLKSVYLGFIRVLLACYLFVFYLGNYNVKK